MDLLVVQDSRTHCICYYTVFRSASIMFYGDYGMKIIFKDIQIAQGCLQRNRKLRNGTAVLLLHWP